MLTKTILILRSNSGKTSTKTRIETCNRHNWTMELANSGKTSTKTRIETSKQPAHRDEQENSGKTSTKTRIETESQHNEYLNAQFGKDIH